MMGHHINLIIIVVKVVHIKKDVQLKEYLVIPIILLRLKDNLLGNLVVKNSELNKPQQVNVLHQVPTTTTTTTTIIIIIIVNTGIEPTVTYHTFGSTFSSESVWCAVRPSVY